MEVRAAYSKEDFEWDQLQRLSVENIKRSNLQLMRKAATASLQATPANSAQQPELAIGQQRLQASEAQPSPASGDTAATQLESQQASSRAASNLPSAEQQEQQEQLADVLEGVQAAEAAADSKSEPSADSSDADAASAGEGV